jgi:two-component system, LuxR family, response regulator FixJ
MKSVAVIDDDPGVLEAVALVLESKGLAVSRYASAAAFLSAVSSPGCVISDLRMPGLNGMELLRALREVRDPRPVILLTAHGDVEIAVQALKQGAFDFIEKPFDEDRLSQAVSAALETGVHAAARQRELLSLRRRYETLTERQKQVMWLLVSGLSNKEVAAQLGISVRTIETYRAWILERMRTRTVVELARISIPLQDGSEAQGSTLVRPGRT